MKIQFILIVGVALLQAAPIQSAGLRNGYVMANFDEFLERARNNSSLKQCKKNCQRTYQKNTRAYNNCETDCEYAYEDWNYFPAGGQCRKMCKKNSDCQVGGFNPCGECGQYVGTEMYQLCYSPKPDPDEEEIVANVKQIDNEHMEPLDFLEHSGGNTCGSHCHEDSDCWQGGVIECGTCNKVHGTFGYNTCISDLTPAPTPWNYFPDGGQCSNHCKKDSDCQKGGFNPCGSCGKYVGTVMYQRCYAPEPYDDAAN